MTRDELIEGMKNLRYWHSGHKGGPECPICGGETIPCKTHILADEAIKVIRSLEEELESIVERYDQWLMTADNVRVFHGDKVWSEYAEDESDFNIVTLACFGAFGSDAINNCYSTYEVAKGANGDESLV